MLLLSILQTFTKARQNPVDSQFSISHSNLIHNDVLAI